jgi:predicted O-methyltransferase YrrM
LERRGFYLPYVYKEAMPTPPERRSYDVIERLFQEHVPAFRGWLAALEDYAADLTAIGGELPPSPRWNQDWFPRLDAAIAYAMVRRHRPRRILEVGAGHTTRFFARAAADAGLDTRIVSIDPAPRATVEGLANVEVDRRPMERCELDRFAELAAGDILTVDSSHVLMPGSDVDCLLNHVLPILPAGTLVHFHDVFLPDDYPAEWCRRGYNEQLGIAAWIMGGRWRIEFASRFVVTRFPETLETGVIATLPFIPGSYESSLWLRSL